MGLVISNESNDCKRRHDHDQAAVAVSCVVGGWCCETFDRLEPGSKPGSLLAKIWVI